MRNDDFASQSEEKMAEKQEGKKPKKTKQEVALDFVLENYSNVLRYDDVTKKAQIIQLRNSDDTVGYWRNVENQDLSDMLIECNKQSGVNVSVNEIRTVLNSSYIPHVHPLRDYVNSLDVLSGFDWIEQVASQVTLKDPSRTELWKRCFKKWFVAMVASWLDEDVVNHTVLVLIGKQGCGKTTWLEQLLPPEIRHYGCKMNSFGDLNKDQRLRLGTYAMLNMDEMEAMTKREMNVIKSIITTKVITERRAYRWDDENFARLASFCGSTNSRQFLNDPTGTRRWLPFEVERIQNPHNRDASTEDIIYRGMYAQAKYLINNHFQYWFDEEEIAELEEHNEEYRLLGTEEELLPLLFTIPPEDKGVFMPNEEIRTTLVDTFNLKTQVSVERVSSIMSRMGFRKATHRINGVKTRGWYVHKLNVDEIAALKKTLR